jgi:hypothetical protein
VSGNGTIPPAKTEYLKICSGCRTNVEPVVILTFTLDNRVGLIRGLQFRAALLQAKNLRGEASLFPSLAVLAYSLSAKNQAYWTKRLKGRHYD